MVVFPDNLPYNKSKSVQVFKLNEVIFVEYQVICHEHIFAPNRFFAQCHASTVEVLPDGTVVCAWFGGSREKAPDTAIWFARRENGCWTDPRKIAGSEGVPCWNPVLFYLKEELFLFYKEGHEIPEWKTFFLRSQDGGKNWSEPEELVPGDTGGRGPVKNKPILLRDGTVLAPASVETRESWTAFTDRSADLSRWEKSSPVPFDRQSFGGIGVIQPSLWQDDAGTVHMLLRSAEGRILQSSSEDGGKNWSPARLTSLPNNNSGIDLVRLEDGRIVLVCNPVGENWGPRSPIALLLSEDNGRTFSEPEILDCVPAKRNEERAEFSYPAIVARGCDLYLTYTWKRKTVAFWQIRLPERRKPDPLQYGVWVTMVTPFKPGGREIDYPATEKLIDWYIQNGVDGLFAVCQSSEMFFLSAEERRELGRFVVEKTAGRVPVVVSGHISERIEEQIAELKDARDSGADAVVLVSNRLAGPDESDEVWKANAQKILDAIPDCTFGIYECPYPYKRLLTPELLRWCAQTGRFAFIKDTCCDIQQIQEKLKAIRGSGIRLFNANSATLLESLRLGAAGFCGVMANFHPELYARLVHRWQQNRQLAEELQNFLTVCSYAELQMYPVSAKYHLSLCGVPVALDSRTKDCAEFSELRRTETRALFQLWQEYALRLPKE